MYKRFFTPTARKRKEQQRRRRKVFLMGAKCGEDLKNSRAAQEKPRESGEAEKKTEDAEREKSESQ
jgi:hypothetical protein